MLSSRSRPLLALLAGSLLASLALPAVADMWLVATEALEVGPADVTLPKKVGVLLAGDRRDLAFEVSGRVVSCVEPGTAVDAGDIVARLDATLEEAQLLQAKLRLREAVSEERRLRGLRAAQATSVRQLESAETALALRGAEVAVAREQLGRRRLVSAISGDVVQTYIEPGEVATPGTRIATVMNVRSLELELGVPGFQIHGVREGARVILQIAALEDASIEASVRRVAGATMDGGHLFEVEVDVSNDDGRLRPGLTVAAEIVIERLASAVRIPLEAVVERAGEPVAFVVRDGVAKAIPLRLAARVGDEVLLETDVPNLELVVRGQADLVDGASVRVDNSVLMRIAEP
jgi:membrane fusion protein (multidrug efflux system)